MELSRTSNTQWCSPRSSGSPIYIPGRFLTASNRPGDGYSTNRLWHEQVDGGRSRLTPAERALISGTLDAFTGAFTGGLPVAEAPSVTTVTHVASREARPLLRS